MSDEQQSFVIKVTRYGLPVVVGIFYLTASLGFSFTSDSTFQMLGAARDATSVSEGFPSPLWRFLLMIGGSLGVDQLLASKVLSLVFSCAAILMMYLVANEILGDRLIAFCVSLVFGMEGWMLQLAPSGSALTLAILLVLTGLFFMLRNEYVVAPFMLGLCTLVFWQAVVLLIPLWMDIWINSVNKRRAAKVALSACIVYCSSLLPLVLYSWSSGTKGLPTMLQVAELPHISVMAAGILGLLGLVGVTGFGLVMRSSEKGIEALRTSCGVVAFMITLVLVGFAYRSQVWLAASPVITVYAYYGFAEILNRIRKQRLLYSLSFVLTGLLIVHLQIEYQRMNKPSMAAAVEQNVELRILSEWLRTNSSNGNSVCAEQPGIVGYYAERPVDPLSENKEPACALVVTSRREVAGYDLAFRPVAPPDDGRHYAVWRKK